MSIANTQADTIIQAGIIDDNDQVLARVEHLKALETLVGNSYPNKFERSNITGKEDSISNILAFEPIIKVVGEIKAHILTLNEGERPNPELKESLNLRLKEFGNVRVSGRLAVPPRVMGKAAFVHLSDGVSRLQIYCRKGDFAVDAETHADAETRRRGDTENLVESENDSLQIAASRRRLVALSPETSWEVFKLLDHGDFIGAEGYLFLTNTGELSVHVETFQFLSKALLPMPDKMHGIADPELKRRFRYADLIASSLQVEHEGLTTREVFQRRARLICGMRSFFDDAGYIEVETPMLTPKATGAAATPFETHHKALDIPLYARIAPELYLKRLTVGGFEKVYELNRNFRNEGLSHKHNPEFTMLEFYCAYMDVNGMMDFAEAMLKESVQKAIGGTKVKTQQTRGSEPLSLPKYRGSLSNPISDDEATSPEYINVFDTEIDFSSFERLTMKEAIAKHTSFAHSLIGEDVESWLDKAANARVLAQFMWWVENELGSLVAVVHGEEIVMELSEDEVDNLLKEQWNSLIELNSSLEPSPQERDLSIVSLFENVVEEHLIQPTFIIDYPKSISPLSKASPENPQIAERFELFINGMEVANGFSELNDPQEQYERFIDQMKERETGDHEAMVMDEDYIRALAYGMPPAAGIGIGIDRLVMLLTNKHSIRDVILFPHMRPERKEAEKEEN